MIASIRRGAPAAMVMLAAGVLLMLMMRIDTIAYAEQRPLYGVAAINLMLASIGPLVPALGILGQALAWYAAGFTLTLALLGLESVGALPLWSLLLVALALTLWPRVPGTAFSAAGICIAVVGGIGTCWLAWNAPTWTWLVTP